MPNPATGGGRRKPRKGTIELRATGWFARLTIDVDGVAIRKWFDLETANKVVATRKMERLIKNQPATPAAAALAEQAKVLETYAEAAERIRKQRRAEGVRDVRNEEIRDALYITPAIGPMDVRTVKAGDIRAILDAAMVAGKSHKTLTHIRAAANTVFDALWREELVTDNPVARVRVPKCPRDRRERVVLTDAELAVYLAWTPDDERYQKAVLERQVLSIMARTFGGLRTGDLHALDWKALQTDGGAFTHGWVPRKKTARPQLLEIPEMLRPFIRDWWERHGRPTSGLMFPALRGPGAGRGAKVGVIPCRRTTARPATGVHARARAWDRRRTREDLGALAGTLRAHRAHPARGLPQLPAQLQPSAGRRGCDRAAGGSSGRPRRSRRAHALPEQHIEAAQRAARRPTRPARGRIVRGADETTGRHARDYERITTRGRNEKRRKSCDLRRFSSSVAGARYASWNMTRALRPTRALCNVRASCRSRTRPMLCSRSLARTCRAARNRPERQAGSLWARTVR
jgi:integrase